MEYLKMHAPKSEKKNDRKVKVKKKNYHYKD